jgi:hypothetical protein
LQRANFPIIEMGQICTNSKGGIMPEDDITPAPEKVEIPSTPKPANRPWYKKKRFIVPIAVVAGLIIAGIGSSGKKTDSASSTQSVATSTPSPSASKAASATPAAPAMSVAQQQAVKKAQSYLNSSAFSRLGLIGQLEFEQFTTADATFAVDYVNPNWNEQAAKKAQSYLKSSSFSRQGLIGQLEFEKFTHEQAVYGVTAVGL